jgi:sterol desaturase/sphingolipid hydroxylase (fatty acid hydroxylase superfamily)
VTSRTALNVAISLTAVGVAVYLAPLPLIGLAVAATIAISIEVLWPLHDRRRSRRALVTDLTHAVGNRYLVLPVVVALITLADPLIGLVVPTAAARALHELPWWGQAAVVFVLTDLGSYLGHRALHQVPALWRLHRVHHSSEHLDWLATSRVHPLDLGINLTAAALPAYALGYAEAQPWILTVAFLYPFIAHANASIDWPALSRVIVTPAFHHWHHATDVEAHDRNFGALLSVWDHLLRTAHRPGGFPRGYGIGEPALDASDYTGHLLAPLRRRAQLPPTPSMAATQSSATSAASSTDRAAPSA